MTTTATSLLLRLREPTDKTAWARFVQIYGPLIYRWAKRTGLSSDDSADLVQDVLTVLVCKLPTFEYDRQRSFRAWLKTVTMNKWRESIRKKSLPMADSSAGDVAVLPEQQATDYWDLDYKKHLVQQAMDLAQHDFQPATWQALRKYLAAAATPDELAAEFGISVWTIYSAKSRLIKRLRDELADLLD